MLYREAIIPATAARPSRTLQQRIFSRLETCDSAPKLFQIHAQIITRGFSQKSFLLAKVISLYTTLGFFRLARQVFNSLATPSTCAWNHMIHLSSADGETSGESVEMLNRMRNQQSKPNEYSYSYALRACAQSGMLMEAKQIHGRVVSDGYASNVFIGTSLVSLYASCSEYSGYEVLYARKVFDEMSERTVVTWNALLSGYVKRGDLNSALRVFQEMPEKSMVSWTTMVSGCARHGQCGQALSFFTEMRRSHAKLDEAAVASALSACAELGDLTFGRRIHSYIKKTCPGRNQVLLVSMQNALIHMYTSCGVVNEAYRVFREIPLKNLVSYTTMILGFANHGHVEKALSLFKSMEANQLRPDAITFVGVLCACSHSGLVEQGRAYFKEMKDKWGIQPSIELYGCMVDLLSRAGLLDEAMGLVQTMPMKPGKYIWGALLGGSRIHRNVEIASYAARNLMLECDPDDAVGYLLLLSDVYAMCGMWKDAALLRKKMVQIGRNKSTGRSQIQVNGIIHDFVAGDWNHKNAASIYAVLDSINGVMKTEEL